MAGKLPFSTKDVQGPHLAYVLLLYTKQSELRQKIRQHEEQTHTHKHKPHKYPIDILFNLVYVFHT